MREKFFIFGAAPLLYYALEKAPPVSGMSSDLSYRSANYIKVWTPKVCDHHANVFYVIETVRNFKKFHDEANEKRHLEKNNLIFSQLGGCELELVRSIKDFNIYHTLWARRSYE